MKLLLILIICVGFFSCSKRIVPDASINWITSDSSSTVLIARRDTIYVKGDTVRLTEQIDCDKVTNKPVPSTVHAKTERAGVSATIDKNGALTVTATCDSLADIVSVMDKEIFRLRHERKEEVKIITEYKTRTIDLICRYIAGGFLLLLIGFIAAKLTKFL